MPVIKGVLDSGELRSLKVNLEGILSTLPGVRDRREERCCRLKIKMLMMHKYAQEHMLTFFVDACALLRPVPGPADAIRIEHQSDVMGK